MYHKMIIFSRYSLDIAPFNCIRELFGDSWTKTLQYLVCQLEVSFISSIGIFSDRETLELLAVSLSFEGLLLRLTFTCFCLICGTVPLVFIYGYCKSRRLSEPYFLSSGLMSPPFSLCGLPRISFNFPVELSHLILCDCHTMVFHYFILFHTFPLFCVDCDTFFASFSEWNCPTFLCGNIT